MGAMALFSVSGQKALPGVYSYISGRACNTPSPVCGQGTETNVALSSNKRSASTWEDQGAEERNCFVTLSQNLSVTGRAEDGKLLVDPRNEMLIAPLQLDWGHCSGAPGDRNIPLI